MGLEKDIQQSKFRNEWLKASVNLLFTSNWVLEYQKRHFDRGGLTPQQYNILRILKGSKTPLSTAKIREKMLDKMSDAGRIVDRLIVKGIVEKRVNKFDKRLVDITISQKGRELIDWMDNYTHELDDATDNLTIEEAQQLNALLDKIREKSSED